MQAGRRELPGSGSNSQSPRHETDARPKSSVVLAAILARALTVERAGMDWRALAVQRGSGELPDCSSGGPASAACLSLRQSSSRTMFRCPGASIPIRTLLGPIRMTVIFTSVPTRIRSPGFLDNTSMASLLFWAVLVCDAEHVRRERDRSAGVAAHRQTRWCGHCDDVIAKSTDQRARKSK